MTQTIEDNYLNILQVVSTPPFSWETGGCARAVYELTKGLARIGNSVNLLTTDLYKVNQRYDPKKCLEIIENVEITRFKLLNYYLAWNYKIYFSPGLIRFIKNNVQKFDIVHLHDLISPHGTATARYCKKYDIPYVLSAHGSVFWLQQKGIMNRLYFKFGLDIMKGASKLIALNDIERKQYIALGISPKLIEIVPNSVDNRQYENLPSYGIFRKKHGLKDEKIILYLGRINKIKGIDLLLDAFSLMSKDNKILVIVGPDEGFLDQLKMKSKTLGIERYVMFMDPLFDMDKFEAYVDANVYVLPSRYEMFPYTVIESLACGTPVVITERCAMSNLIGESGRVSKFDKNSLKNSIIEMLDDKNNRKASISGKKMVKEKFDISVTVKQMESIYENILQEKKNLPHNIPTS